MTVGESRRNRLYQAYQTGKIRLLRSTQSEGLQVVKILLLMISSGLLLAMISFLGLGTQQEATASLHVVNSAWLA